jgi:hypothetical protein
VSVSVCVCVCAPQALLFVASLPGAASLLSELAAIARDQLPAAPRPRSAATEVDGAGEEDGEAASERRERAARRELVRVLCHRGLFHFVRCGRGLERLLRRSLSGRHARSLSASFTTAHLPSFPSCARLSIPLLPTRPAFHLPIA